MTDSKQADSDFIIQVTGLSCGYGETTVLQGVSFSVERGEIFFVVGRSGCGKSTLLRNLIGLESPLEGEIRFGGQPLTGAGHDARRTLMRRMGITYQNSALWSTMTVGENVALPLEEHTSLTRDEIHDLVAVKLGMVGLAGSESTYPSELSGGMRKRAALARALILDPEILFFDEPSAGLDPVSARNLDRLILQTRENLGTTVVVVSHDVESICTVADRVVMLGRETKTIIASGTLRHLLREEQNPHVLEFFGGERVLRDKDCKESE